MLRTVKERIQSRLKALNLKPQTASKLAGLDKDAVRNILRGRSAMPRAGALSALAPVLQCDVRWLMLEPGAPQPSVEIRNRPGLPKSGFFNLRSDLKSGTIPIIELELRVSSGGGGALDMAEDGTVPLAVWQVPSIFLAEAGVASDPSGLRIISVTGDSMEPTFRVRDRVVVNTLDKTPSPPGVFIVWDGLGLVIKRVELLSDSDPLRVLIQSENPKYKTYERVIGEAHIQGRVIAHIRWT